MFTNLSRKTSDARQKTCICNCINCVHNCEDHSTSFDFISAVIIWFISYTSITFSHLLHRNIWTHNCPVPNISGAGIARSRVQIPSSPEFFLVSSYTQLHKLPPELRGSFYIWSFLGEMVNHFIRPGFPVSPDIKLVSGAFLLRKYGDGPWNEIELKWTTTIFCYW